jgi:FtsP/CotA-like multicopper oxidase with cupredoxin domain
MEFTYRLPSRFMFHAHVSEFAELGWMGLFDVVEE